MTFSDIPFELNINYFPGTGVNNENISMDLAKTITLNNPVDFVLAPVGNKDWFSFDASESQELFVKVDNLAEGDIVCSLKDKQDKTIQKISLSADAKNNKITIPEAGNYYLHLYFDYSHISSSQEMKLTLLNIEQLNALTPNEDAPLEEVGEEELSAKEKSLDFAKQAFAALNKNEYSQSVELYKKAIELYEDARYFHDMGIAYFKQKKWTEAKEVIVKALVLDQNYALAHKTLGSVYGELKEYESSLKEFTRALELNRDDPMLYYNIARSYEGLYIQDDSQIEYLKSALKYSQKAIKEISGDPKVINQNKRLKEKISLLKSNKR